MRTTITLDEDVAMAIQEFMTSTGASFKSSINDLLRSGLRFRSEHVSSVPFVVRTYDTGGTVDGLDLDEAIRRLEEFDARTLASVIHPLRTVEERDHP